ncbi:MAG: universal stress protein [Acidilobus sp.]
MTEPTYYVSFWFREILVPVDGSASSLKALDLAVDFARRYGSRITVLAAVRGDPEQVRRAVESRVGGVAPYGFKYAKLDEATSPANEILKELGTGKYDAVIIGARGLTVSDVNIGSTAMAVVANAPVTAIIVR